MKRILSRLANEGCGYWGGAVVLFLAVLITGNAVLRYAFSRPQYYVEEISALLLMTLFFLALPYTFLKGGHVKITVLTAQIPPKVRAWMEVIASLVTFLFLCFFIRLMYTYIHTSYELNCHTQEADLYLFPWLLPSLLGPALFAIFTLLDIIRKLRVIK